MNLNTKIEVITPDMARQYLTTNKKNRALSRSTVDAYAQEMKLMRWQLNGEAIIFDEVGLLVNGQHRLSACAQANTPFQSVVIRGVSQHAFETLDSGKKRNAADAFSINGEINVSTLSTVARSHFANRNGFQSRVSSTQSISTILHEADNYPSIKNLVNNKHYSRLMQSFLKGSGLGVFAYAQTLGWVEEVDQALFLLSSGQHDDTDEPMWVLRERLISQKASTEALKPHVFNAYVIKALNAFLQKKRIKILRFKADDLYPVLIVKNSYKNQQ